MNYSHHHIYIKCIASNSLPTIDDQHLDRAPAWIEPFCVVTHSWLQFWDSMKDSFGWKETACRRSYDLYLDVKTMLKYTNDAVYSLAFVEMTYIFSRKWQIVSSNIYGRRLYITSEHRISSLLLTTNQWTYYFKHHDTYGMFYKKFVCIEHGSSMRNCGISRNGSYPLSSSLLPLCSHTSHGNYGCPHRPIESIKTTSIGKC